MTSTQQTQLENTTQLTGVTQLAQGLHRVPHLRAIQNIEQFTIKASVPSYVLQAGFKQFEQIYVPDVGKAWQLSSSQPSPRTFGCTQHVLAN